MTPHRPGSRAGCSAGKVDLMATGAAQGGTIDVRQIYFNAVLGGGGGLCGWLLVALAGRSFLGEVSTYPRMLVYGLLLGVCIGGALGSAEGLVASRSLRRVLKGGSTGAMLGALGGALGLAL